MKQLLAILLFLCSASVFAQDVIVKKDGSTIVCRIVELTSSEIIYKKWSDLKGSNYVMERSAASAINYENGKKVDLSESVNLYKPNNQNDGVQQYNDQALRNMDYLANMQARTKKIKTLKKIGWICGAALTGFGLVYGVVLDGDSEQKSTGRAFIIGGLVVGAGILIPTYLMDIKAKQTQAISLYQEEWKFKNNSSLSIGTDLLSDRTIGTNALGLGFRFNF